MKHKRQEFSIAELIGSLDIDEKARAKDTHKKGVESSTANMVQRKNNNASHNKKKKNMKENNSKPNQTTTFKKKKVVALFAGAMSTRQVRAQTVNSSKKRKLQTWLLARLKEKHLGMEILYLLFFQFVIRLSGGWILGLT
jgi:tartrate dehydratase alpha subunit/fumarate hydratase class I-like protein